jgi:hypothetical protein
VSGEFIGRRRANGEWRSRWEFGAQSTELIVRRWQACSMAGSMKGSVTQPSCREAFDALMEGKFSSIRATQMLGSSLSSGGQNVYLNPLYQIGGPRSVHLL